MKFTMAVLLAIHELALKLGAIWPLLTAKAVLIVCVEFADVAASIGMHVDALPAGLAFFPEAFVAIPVGMN